MPWRRYSFPDLNLQCFIQPHGPCYAHYSYMLFALRLKTESMSKSLLKGNAKHFSQDWKKEKYCADLEILDQYLAASTLCLCCR